jgi:hypothetical protein
MIHGFVKFEMGYLVVRVSPDVSVLLKVCRSEIGAEVYVLTPKTRDTLNWKLA